VLVFLEMLIFETLYPQKFLYLIVWRRIRNEIFDWFAVAYIFMVCELFYELGRLKCWENSLRIFTNLSDSKVISDYKIQIHIIFPFCPASHRICFHGCKSQEWWNFYHSLNVLCGFYIKWIVEKSNFYIMNNPSILALFMNMKDLPLCLAPIQNGLDSISLEIFLQKKIKIYTFPVSEMECNCRTSYHIKMPLSWFTEKFKKFYLFRGKYFKMHVIWQGNGTNKKWFEVRDFVHDGSF
jgi:hypothetical protein